MYIYCDKKINNPLYIHFLCGNKYKRNKQNDKRNILKSYIDSIDNNYALILEKLFEPKEYSSMGFIDLEQVELMASHYAKSVIILHETVSTAAEIALFGSKELLKNKILVIYAPKEIIETDVVGNFIRLAYFRNDKVKNSSFNYKTKLYNITGKSVAYYNTFFQNDVMDDSFVKILNDFWSSSANKLDISLTKENSINKKDNTYRIEEKRIKIKLNYEFILSIILSILLNPTLIKNIRNEGEIVKNLCSLIRKILKNTISVHEFKNVDDYSVEIRTNDKQDINLPIRFCIYILIKAGLLNIRNNQISITSEFKEKNKEYRDLLQFKEEPDFFSNLSGDKYE